MGETVPWPAPTNGELRAGACATGRGAQVLAGGTAAMAAPTMPA
jgi:hypothetical protein